MDLPNLNLNLCIFTSTKQHWGRHDIYQKSLVDLAKKLDLDKVNKYVHIKADSISKLLEMQKFYESYGFAVIVTEGTFRHFEDSHQLEYLKDIKKMYLDIVDRNTKFCLHLEDDWLFQTQQLVEEIYNMENFLCENKEIVSCRFPRFHNEVERIGRLRQKHGLDVDVAYSPDYPDFFVHNDNLSLNPTIFRTSDIITACRIAEIQQNINHVEHDFTRCLSILSRHKFCYSFVNPKHVNVLHIGTEEGKEDQPNTQILDT